MAPKTFLRHPLLDSDLVGTQLSFQYHPEYEAVSTDTMAEQPEASLLCSGCAVEGAVRESSDFLQG